MTHAYPRTERDLRRLAAAFSSGTITRALPERLECLAAWHRLSVEAEKASDDRPHGYEQAVKVFNETIRKMRAAGVGPSEGEYAFSPCMGPDLP